MAVRGLRHHDRDGILNPAVAAPGVTAAPRAAARRATPSPQVVTGTGYVHSPIDDYSRLAYSEILPHEEGATYSAFLLRAVAYFARHGVSHIERVMTDNAWAYRYALGSAIDHLGAKQVFIRPHCPWQNGKGRTPQPHAPKRMGLSNRVHFEPGACCGACALARALQQSTPSLRSGRPHSDQPTVTNVTAEYI